MATTASSQGVIISGNAACLATVADGLRTHGDLVTDLNSANAVVGVMHRQDVLAVAELPCVTAVSSDAKVKASATPVVGTSSSTTASFGPRWVSPRHRRPERRSASQSSTAASPLTDFGTRIRAFYDFTTGATL